MSSHHDRQAPLVIGGRLTGEDSDTYPQGTLAEDMQPNSLLDIRMNTESKRYATVKQGNHRDDTIDILGSGGFIGKALKRSNINKCTVRYWGRREHGHQFNLLDAKSWNQLLNSKPVTVILLSWPRLQDYDSSHHLTENLPASIELIKRLIDVGARRIVGAGTCYEYGVQNGPLKESDPTDPLYLYAVAKDSLRRAMKRICEESNVSWAWLRIFFAYGEGQNSSSLLPSLEKAIDEGRDHFDMGSGRKIRDYVKVERVAEMLLRLASSGQYHGVYNGGSGVPRSLREIAEARIAERRSRLMLRVGMQPDREGEPMAFWADMNKWDACNRQ